MYLSLKTVFTIDDITANYIGHMAYSAFKLWNVCSYERRHYDSNSNDKYPDWYYQRSAHKGDLWYKNLPSQKAQEVLKLLDGAWKSYFTLLKTGGVENPHPPKFKQEGIPITYMQNGIKQDGDAIRLTIPKALKKHMLEKYGLNEKYLFLKNIVFKKAGNIKQIKLSPPKNNRMDAVIIYEVPDVQKLEDNGHYLSIDLGLHNLMTCYDSNGSSFIAGRQYLSICRKFDKEIARVQSQWHAQQSAKGIKHPKSSEHIKSLYERKHNCIHDYLHKVTRAAADYCKSHDIHTVVIGDITGIRRNVNFTSRVNQQFHGLPYSQIYRMLKYKLALYGISFIKQKEYYTSQCSPYAEGIDAKHAVPKNRIKRGLYFDNGRCFNADALGAYNILRLYMQKKKINQKIHTNGLSSTYILKVAV